MFPELPVAKLPETQAHLLAAPDGSTVLRTPAGRFLRLREQPPGLLDVLAGTAVGDEETAAYLDALRQEIASRQAADAEARWPSTRRDVALAGAGPVLDELAEALAEWGVDPQRFGSPLELLEADNNLRDTHESGTYGLVVAYADSPPERARWNQLDALPGRGYAWLRAYREGEICFVDPVSLSVEDAGSEQVRRRRLAASLVPGPLAAWQQAAPSGTAPLSVSARVLVVGRLLAVATAWAKKSEQLADYRQTLWKFVPATGTVSEHPVLGYEAPYVPDEPVVRR